MKTENTISAPKKLNVNVIEFTGVMGKKTKYLLIGDEKDQLILRIGQKTFDGVNKMLEKINQQKS